MRTRVAILIALTTLMLIPSAGTAAGQTACTSSLDLAEAIERADVVFVGRVIEATDRNRVATMEVEAVWKGEDLPEEVVVNGDTSIAGAQPRTFQPGATYLVFPTNRRPPFSDHKCTATRIYRSSGLLIPGNLVDAVGATSARPPIPASAEGEAGDGSGGGIPVSFGIVMFLIAGLMLAVFAYQRFATGGGRTNRDMIGSERGRGAPASRKSIVKRPSRSERIKDAFMRASDERRFKRARKRARR